MERLEEAREFFGGNAGAGIDDVEAEEGALAFDDAFDTEGDFAVLRKFAGVREQVQQALTDFDDVGEHAADAGGEDDVEGIAILFGHGADEFDDFVDQFGDEKVGGVNFDLAGLDFGHFENGVDEFEEVFAGGLDFLEILNICDEEGAVVHLVTNGTFLSKFGFETFFKAKCLRQINFSLHSFKDNYPGQDLRPYLFDILQFSKLALTERPELYINYRLWNLPSATAIKDENQDFIDIVSEFFQIPITEKVDTRHRKSKNILGRIYFHFDTRFEWPSFADPIQGEKGFCHALSQQIGIHADGTVVPCCFDKEAGIPLGNVLETDFESILASPKLTRMREGFAKHLLTEELCQKCTYIKRFQKKVTAGAAPTLSR